MAAAVTPEEARGVLDRCASDPDWFYENILGETLWHKQREIAFSVRDNKRTAVRSCHGAGKSFLAARIVLWWEFSHPGAIAVTTAPTYRQVQKVIWQEIRRSYKKAKYPLGGECLTTELRLDDGWYAFGLSTDDPDAFQGIHSYTGRVLVVLDEASGIPRDLYPAFDGVTTGDKCRLFMIGNPTDPYSAFADEFKQSDVAKFKIDAFHTPNLIEQREVIPGLVTQNWVDDKKKRWGEDHPLYVSRVLAEFPEGGDKTLYPLSWLERAQQTDYKPTNSAEVELGVDVARYGTDESVIAYRKGKRVRIFKTIRKADTMEVTGEVIKAYRQLNASIAKVDVVGIGAGVVDRLIEQGFNVAPMGAGEASSDPERFGYMRDEWYWGFREAIENTEVDLDSDEELLSQAARIQYGTDSKGRIKVESKDKMKGRGLSSPDRLEAVLLAWAPADTLGPVELW